MLRLLFIEDEPDAVEPVVNLLRREQPEYQCIVSSFANSETDIREIRPDIVVLDLLVSGASSETEAEGLKTRDHIWNQQFCPIVIYSARPDVHDRNREGHPFVRSVQKGKDSSRQVAQVLSELRPQVEALREAEEHVRQCFSLAMKHVAPSAFEAFTETAQRMEAVKRSGRRRLAALMDGLTQDGTKLACWEQYLCPPISSDTKLADILRQADKAYEDPTAFRLVLTPSCDLVKASGRSPKVRIVLTAKCSSIGDGLKLTTMKDMPINKLKERLAGTVLSHGYLESMIPFPSLKGRIPTMAANLRDLDLIPIDDIGDSGKHFVRIASIDSPFRELISWAYLQIACRPGVPDRDFDAWRDEIVSYLESTKKQGTT